MSEFLDFLKHKYAYVAIGAFKPGRFNEAEQLFVKAVSTYSEGFEGAYLLQKPGTDEGIAVIFWDNLEDMDANRNDLHEALIKEMGHLFAGPPETCFYEVASEVQPQAKA
ncbi:antibiotic biosynthesis monooxygenase [Spirulina sp. CCNP1310]|uniref:antibiotic biosynthesis monooxygenase family protein n=1 Tax=Spirulina sp. CCNP1310 TaxID=3110249 RepID=UPI002B208DF8|nr:antibiotic biosynthesis monooxygenase [Spirulina sp. CCNP1310]MEA5419872.1 antibiotic biosynthesis monooxygenase [Spirulina sp. CCNP1310]